ncbi:MAG: hypothetical protein JWO06_1345 [Bacteroidota bacterium]|nr:hypothetical protein [Bacteroidota bacterium]
MTAKKQIMVFKYKKIFGGLLLAFAFMQMKASDTLTIRQAFNWQVGDTFIYSYYDWGNPSYPSGYHYYPDKKGFTVKARTDLNDSIIYTIQNLDNTIAQRIFTKLDSPVTNFQRMYQFLPGNDTISLLPICNSTGPNCSVQTYYDTSFNNLLTLYQLYNGGEVMSYYYASERVGLRQIESSTLEWWPPQFWGAMGVPGGAGATLSYFRSDSILWIDSAIYFVSGITEKGAMASFHIYPNPTSNILFIERGSNSSASAEIKICDLQSRLVAIKQFPVNTGKQEIDISNLSAGVYIVLLDDNNGQTLYRSKVVKQ